VRAKPKRRPLSREGILAAALEIIDQEGLAAVSMRRVGEMLGVEAMSLYNHVPSKAALLDGVYEQILATVERPSNEKLAWPEHVRRRARAFRAALAAHPNAIPLFATRPAAAPGALVQLEHQLDVLRRAGLAPMDALGVVQIVLAFVVGHTAWSLGPRSEDATVPAYLALDPATFPNVRELAAEMGDYDPEQEFERGLDALVDGLTRRFR
jgi:AcrR family transcriptional regulator